MSVELKIGDKVAVLDDTIKGIITKIDSNEITIEAFDGFLLSFEKSELVLIKENQKEFSKYIDIQHDVLLEKDIAPRRKQSIKSPKNGDQPPLEVDLHIHQLTKSTKGMTIMIC